MMPELAQCLQPGARTVSVLAGRVAADDELVGLRRIDEQVLPLQALATQQGDFRLDVAARAAVALGTRQVEQGLVAIALGVVAVGLVEVAIERDAGATGQAGQGENQDQGTHGEFLRCCSVSANHSFSAVPAR